MRNGVGRSFQSEREHQFAKLSRPHKSQSSMGKGNWQGPGVEQSHWDQAPALRPAGKLEYWNENETKDWSCQMGQYQGFLRTGTERQILDLMKWWGKPTLFIDLWLKKLGGLNLLFYLFIQHIFSEHLFTRHCSGYRELNRTREVLAQMEITL